MKLDALGAKTNEVALLTPLVGSTMLELGNKVKGDIVYKDVFISYGFEHTSIDVNGQNGALNLDLRHPLNLGTFDMVTNLGTTEHVAPGKPNGQAACWRNILEAMHVGSVLVSVTPKPGAKKWLGHGCWYPGKLFFMELSRLNGLILERCYAERDLIHARLRRIEEKPFKMTMEGMVENRRWRPNRDNIC